MLAYEKESERREVSYPDRVYYGTHLDAEYGIQNKIQAVRPCNKHKEQKED